MSKTAGLESAPLPLAGVRVLDFGRYIAGPYCAALLADYGADVVRIEKQGGSEDRYVTPVTTEGEGALFLQMNRNKRSLALDPTSPRGREITRRLVATADIVVANLPQQSLEAMGLSYRQLVEIKPDIILVTASAFGAEGPWKDRVGFDSIGQAMCGAAYLSGDEVGPARAQAPWVDFGTALHCAFGALLALMERRATGRGQHVQGALLDTALAVMNAQMIEQAVLAPNRTPLGSGSATAAPVGLFETRDGWITCHVVGQPLFERLARLVDRADWIGDPSFSSDRLRGENREPILAVVRDWCRARTQDQALDQLGRARIPAGPVLSPQQSLDHPQVQASGLLQRVDYPGLPVPAPVAMAPVRLSLHAPILRPPPTLGADTKQILLELGLFEAEPGRTTGLDRET